MDEEIQIAPKVRERVRGHIQLTRINRGIRAEFDVSVEGEAICSRCLTPYHRIVKLVLSEEFHPYGDVPEGDEKALLIDQQNNLDTQEVFRQSFIVNRPSKLRCTPHCKGICPNCGADRNLVQCQCGQDREDLRWVTLAELLTPL